VLGLRPQYGGVGRVLFSRTPSPGSLERPWFGAPFFVGVVLMVDLDRFDQHAAMAQATGTTAIDDIIQQELNRRSEFDKTFREAIGRLALQIRLTDRSDVDQCRRNDTELHRLTAKITREAMFRSAFDRQHPAIYPTPEARQKAYAAIDPSTWPVAPAKNPPRPADE
jgi:hypothetical protein